MQEPKYTAHSPRFCQSSFSEESQLAVLIWSNWFDNHRNTSTPFTELVQSAALSVSSNNSMSHFKTTTDPLIRHLWIPMSCRHWSVNSLFPSSFHHILILHESDQHFADVFTIWLARFSMYWGRWFSTKPTHVQIQSDSWRFHRQMIHRNICIIRCFHPVSLLKMATRIVLITLRLSRVWLKRFKHLYLKSGPPPP